jgi:hypothetical protein
VELGALTLDFKPRTTIKSQALVDFMEEWRENQVEAATNLPEHWVMYIDSSLKLKSGGAEVLFISPIGKQLKYVFQIVFEVSNNEAEYEALRHRLRLPGHQATTCLWRLLAGGRTSQPGVGYQQGHHGRVRRGNTQAREQVLGVGNSSCDSRQQYGSGCALETGFRSS